MSRLHSILDRCNANGVCIEWEGYCKPDGYGRAKVNGKMVYVHRYVFQELTGIMLSAEDKLDHLCRNPPCCDPNHLEVVTQIENTLRGNSPTAVNARKTHCPSGHPFDEKNTYHRKSGGRTCRACDNLRAKERKMKNKIGAPA